jgi:hypothetical protein
VSTVVTPLRPAFAIGIDPGATTGIVMLHLTAATLGDAAEIFQGKAADAPGVLRDLLASRSHGERGRCGIEGFAPGNGPGARRKPGRLTSGQVEELAGICAEYGVPCQARYAALVKPWATDRRLRAAGLLALTTGKGHARDACRHALYCAVCDCGYPDPLSRTAAQR